MVAASVVVSVISFLAACSKIIFGSVMWARFESITYGSWWAGIPLLLGSLFQLSSRRSIHGTAGFIVSIISIFVFISAIIMDTFVAYYFNSIGPACPNFPHEMNSFAHDSSCNTYLQYTTPSQLKSNCFCPKTEGIYCNFMPRSINADCDNVFTRNTWLLIFNASFSALGLIASLALMSISFQASIIDRERTRTAVTSNINSGYVDPGLYRY